MKIKGVTLPELLVVLTIISIMASMALPGVMSLFLKKSINHQADDFVALFSQVRENAIKQGHRWRIIFWPDEGKWICFSDENDNSKRDSNEQQIGPIYLVKGVSFGSLASAGPNNTKIDSNGVSFTDNKVSFSSMGCCNAGTIYLKSYDKSIAIRVLPSSGLIRLYEYNKSWQVMR